MNTSQFNQFVREVSGIVVIDARSESHQYAVIVPSPRSALDNSIERYSRGCFDDDSWREIVVSAHEVFT